MAIARSHFISCLFSDSKGQQYDDFDEEDDDDGDLCLCCFESRDAVSPILTPKGRRRRRRDDDRRRNNHHHGRHQRRRRRDDDDDDYDSSDGRGGGVRREQKSIEIQCDLPSFEALPPGVLPPSPRERNRSSTRSDNVRKNVMQNEIRHVCIFMYMSISISLAGI